MRNHWMNRLMWIISFEIIGGFLGYLTQSNIHSWYEGLHKSTLTPPPIVFSIVWPILYALLAIVGARLWQERKNPALRPAIYCYTLQLFMNWTWTTIFFQLHWIGIGFVWIVLLAYVTLATIYLIKDNMQRTWMLLVPYVLWLMFASYLNGVIWLGN